MPEKPDLFKEERAAVLRYLEEKKLGLKKAALSEKLEIARSAKEAAWAAVEVAKDAQRTAKVALSIQSSRRRLSQQRLLRRSCLSETMKVAACPP